jgi:hypothetical protein
LHRTAFGAVQVLRGETQILKIISQKLGFSAFVSAHLRPISQFRKVPEGFGWSLFGLSINNGHLLHTRKALPVKKPAEPF